MRDHEADNQKTRTVERKIDLLRPFLIASKRFFARDCIPIVLIVRQGNFQGSRLFIALKRRRFIAFCLPAMSSSKLLISWHKESPKNGSGRLPLDPVARAAQAVLDDPEVLRVQRRISLDVLVDESTLRSRRADPSSIAERRRPAEFDRNNREGVDPELAAVFRDF